MLVPDQATLTPKESYMLEYEERNNDKQIEYGLTMKRLDIEQQKLESKWNTWIRIPVLIIKLPVYILLAIFFGIAYIAHVIRGVEPSDKFWDILRSYLLLK